MPPDNDVQKEIEQLEQRYADNSQGLVFAHLADAYRRAGEHGKAEGLILHGLKYHPNYISAYNVLGRVYLDSERYSDAHGQFSKVLELDPQNMIAMRALGDLAVRGGRLEDARTWFERILQLDPRNEEAQEELQKLGPGESTPAPRAAAPPPVAEPSEPTAAGEAEVPGEGAPPVEEVVAPWEEHAGAADVSAEPPEVEPVEGLQAFESRAVERPVDDSGEIELGDMNDWTPGFLREEDVEGQAGEDLGVRSLREEFGGAAAPEAAPGAAGEEAGGEPQAASPAGEGVVTETMAELYADQGLYGDALSVYRQLAQVRPEDERIRARIAELEGKLAEASAPAESEVDLAELLDLTESEAVEGAAASEVPEEPALFEPPPEQVTAPEAPGPADGSAAPAGEPGFDFEDEAPVAGIEHLDPFASSFDVMVKRGDAAPTAAEVAREPPEAVEPELEIVPTAAAAEPELEVASVEDVQPTGADIAPPEEIPGPAFEAPLPTPAAERPSAGPTIEEYLAGLLAYSSEAQAGAPDPGAPGASEAARSKPSEAAAPDESSDASSPEDLEEFQRWLRSLKE